MADETPSMEISAQDYHSCAINSDKYVSCWGFSSSGAISVPEDIGKVSQVSLGGDSFFDHSCAVTESGAVRCWGSNDSGQTNVPTDIGKVRQLDAGGKHTCAINEYSLLRCWGRNNSGQVSVPTNLGPVRQVSAGQWNTCAITEEKTVRCWGSNFSGQLAVPAGLEDVAQISTGSEHVCALKTNGQLLCWGVWWDSGPANLTTEAGKYTQVSSGPWNTCAVSINGEVECWGFNRASLNSFWAQDDRRFRQVAAGLRHACAVQTSGNLVCYGDNTWGQLNIPVSSSPGLFSSSGDAVVNLPGTSSYYSLNMNRTNWETAAAQAASMRFRDNTGHLANITSKTENDFIASLLAEKSVRWEVDHAWFGAKAANWPDFKFSSGLEVGQSLSYTNWLAGEPNNYGNGAEDFAVIRPDGTWNDYCNCNGLWSVVEFNLPPSPVVEKKTLPRLVAPVVKGKSKVGSVLSASVTSMGSRVSYSYQWLRDGVAIEGATERKYVLGADDANSTVTFEVCGSKPSYETACLESNSSVVALGELRRQPKVGLAWTSLKPGALIQARSGAWDAGVTVSYSWLRDGVEIATETEATYQLTEADRGHTIAFKVIAQKVGYNTVTRTTVSKLIP